MSASASPCSPRWQNLRIVLSAGAVLLLICFARTKDLFSDFSRPTVTFALHLLGIGAVDHGSTIAVGRLEVPWTRDCAGLNLLLVIAALTIWVNRAEPAGFRYWMKIVLSVPAALLANVLRVLSLIGYREAFYPHVESPQLHYFLGLVWLMPFLAMVVPRGRRPLSQVLVESLQAAAVIALLAPMSGVPGGQTITIAALIGLAHCRFQAEASRQRSILTLAWIFLAVVIALLGMESFWLPWLLLSPLLASRRWICSLPGAILTAATHPLFGLIPGGAVVAWMALGYLCWKWLRGGIASDEPAGDESVETAGNWLFMPQAVSVLFLLPFVASTIFARGHADFLPPANTTYTAIASDAFDVRMQGQPENIGLVWFNPSGNGRHHSMKVCMKYRGVDLEPTRECADVFTDGQRWMREFYLQDGRLVPSYRAYLVSTFRPLSSPGVHLIFVTTCDQMSATAFDHSCVELASHLDARNTCTLPVASVGQAPSIAANDTSVHDGAR